jgi:hypothetical protein
VTRSIDFELQVTAYGVDGEIDTAFSEDVTLAIDSGDPSDVLSIVTLLAASFTNGTSKITNQQFNGGSGTDVTVISATGVSGITGTTETVVDAGILVKGVSNTTGVRDIGTYDDPDENTLTTAMPQTQFDTIADALAEPMPGFGSFLNTVDMRIRQPYSYDLLEVAYSIIGSQCHMNATDRQDVVGAAAEFQVSLQLTSAIPITQFIPNMNSYRFHVGLYEAAGTGSAPEFASGSAVQAAIGGPTWTEWSLYELKERMELVSTDSTPWAGEKITLPIDESFITGMTLDVLRVWMYLEVLAPTPYVYPWTEPQFCGQYLSMRNLSVELYKAV